MRRNRRRKRRRTAEEDRRRKMLSQLQRSSSVGILSSLQRSSFTRNIILVVCAIICSEFDYLMAVLPPLVPDYRFHPYNCGTERTQGLSAEHLFRFSEDQLYALVVALELPNVMRTAERDRFRAIEGLCLVLRRLIFPVRYVDLVVLFGRQTGPLSRIFRYTLAWLYARWFHLAAFDVRRFDHRVAEWAAAVREISPDAYENVILFIDGTVRPTCKPGPNERRLPPGITLDQLQRAQYNGHKRRHAFKGHALISPSGMVVHYFGAVDGRRHDVHLLNASGLFAALHTLTMHGVDYIIYGDSAYPVTRNMASPIPRNQAPPGSAARALNHAMSRSRVCTSEWWFGVNTNTFQTLDFARWQRQWLTLPAVQYHVALLLVNCRTCLDGGNRISGFFDCSPPDLVDYLAGQF